MTRKAVFHDAGSFDDGSPITSFPGAIVSVFGRTGTVVATAGDYYAVLPAALTGATQAFRIAGATTSGAPVSGTFAVGDLVAARDGHLFMCISAGTPGTWVDTGGSVSFATPAIALGSSAAAGSAGTAIRSDSTIAAFDATSPSTQAFGDAAAVGTAAFAARRDHKHAMPAAPSDASVTFTDITTNNSATGQHGFLKKLDGNAAHYMGGDGNWSTPAGTATGMATDPLWAAAGDLAVATGNDAATVLGIGADGTGLKSNGTTAAWVPLPKRYLNKPAGNITRAATSVGAFSTAWQITGVVVAAGQNVYLRMFAATSTPSAVDTLIVFKRGSTQIASNNKVMGSGMNFSNFIALEWIDENPGAGTYTYEVQAAQFGSGTLTVYTNNPTTDTFGGTSIFIAEVYTP